MEKQKIAAFRRTVWNFYKQHGRSFSWRNTVNPYNILVSEIMLQQTQADRVVAYYNAWVKRFPDFATLAKTPFHQIYPLWQGLGYNRRALAMQKLAQIVTQAHAGKLPRGLRELENLPGIGPYTARAISIFSYNRPLVCIETNIRRVFIHHFFADAETVSDRDLLPYIESALPAKRSREWHWALMDYGAHLKSAVPNPNRRHKQYTVQSKFEGSVRQIRGDVLRQLATGPKSLLQLAKAIKRDNIAAVANSLKTEGFIDYKNSKYHLS